MVQSLAVIDIAFILEISARCRRTVLNGCFVAGIAAVGETINECHQCGVKLNSLNEPISINITIMALYTLINYIIRLQRVTI